jgi:Holliday junction DNA helicase RuvA
MIGFLRGEVAARDPEGCTIDVSGVGYRLQCSATTLAQIPAAGGSALLWTHLHVREDALALYGFATEAERTMFEALISVTGVGPRVALQMCSAFGADSLRRALVTEDVTGLSSVPGIGKKTAARIVLELKEKLALPDLEVVAPGGEMTAQARSALENLGYSAPEVRAALADLAPAPGDGLEDVVREGLRRLAAQRSGA